MQKRNARVFDMSHYDIMPDYAALVAGGVDAIILKDDAMTEVHVARARAAGMLVLGLYGWVDPNYDGKQQASRFIQRLDMFGIPSGWADAEQEYKYFAQYLAALQGKIPQSAVIKIPQADIRRVNMDYSDTLDEWGMDTKHITGIYSRDEWLKRIFCQPSDKLWLASKRHWGALYTYYPRFETTLTFAQLWERGPVKPYGNYLKNPVVDPMLWQWTGDRARIPGVKIPIDGNFMRGTKEEMYAYFGISKTPLPTVVDFDTAQLKPEYSALNKRPFPADFSYSVGIIHASETIMLEKGLQQVVPSDNGKSMTWVKVWNEKAWINQAYIDYVK
jgi:hypothetical protein